MKMVDDPTTAEFLGKSDSEEPAPAGGPPRSPLRRQVLEAFAASFIDNTWFSQRRCVVLPSSHGEDARRLAPLDRLSVPGNRRAIRGAGSRGRSCLLCEGALHFRRHENGLSEAPVTYSWAPTNVADQSLRDLWAPHVLQQPGCWMSAQGATYIGAHVGSSPRLHLICFDEGSRLFRETTSELRLGEVRQVWMLNSKNERHQLLVARRTEYGGGLLKWVQEADKLTEASNPHRDGFEWTVRFSFTPVRHRRWQYLLCQRGQSLVVINSHLQVVDESFESQCAGFTIGSVVCTSRNGLVVERSARGQVSLLYFAAKSDTLDIGWTHVQTTPAQWGSPGGLAIDDHDRLVQVLGTRIATFSVNADGLQPFGPTCDLSDIIRGAPCITANRAVIVHTGRRVHAFRLDEIGLTALDPPAQPCSAVLAWSRIAPYQGHRLAVPSTAGDLYLIDAGR
jgi:hypothetical protein